jgi:hypothetical protein
LAFDPCGARASHRKDQAPKPVGFVVVFPRPKLARN